MKRYLAVIEIDCFAEDDLAAAIEARRLLKELQEPQIYVKPINDAGLEPWTGVDFAETDELGFPYVGDARPICFDFAS